MRERKNKSKFLLYPEDSIKENWDFFITIVLIITCITTPWRIAFGEIDEPLGWQLLSKIIDSMFFIDMLVIFNSSFYNDDFQIIESRKAIA